MTEAVALTDVVRRIARGYRFVALCGLLGAALALTYLSESPPIYQSEVRVMIDPRPMRLPGREARSQPITENRTAIAALESEVRVVKSAPVLLAVVDALKLDRDREFASPSQTLAERASAAIGLAPVAPKHIFCGAGADKVGDCPSGARLTALRQLQKAVTVQRASKSYVLIVRARSEASDKARRIADAIVTAYVAESRRSGAERLETARREIESGFAALEGNVRAGERRIDEATRRLKIVGGSRGDVDRQQLDQLTRDLVNAQVQTETLRASDAQLSQLVRSGGDLDTEVFTEAPALEALRLQTATLASQEGAARAQFGPRHPETAALAAQLDRNRMLLRQELARTAEAVHRDYRQAREAETALSARVEALTSTNLANSRALVELHALERVAAADGAVLQASTRRATELAQGSVLVIANLRVLGPAETPRGPATPRLWLVLVATAAGLTTGICVLAMRSRPHRAETDSLIIPYGTLRA